ncbi:class I SAM-dependent methyltransferase [Kitasatospora sp. NBC_01287]|uniref:class I SAM-dependent methyltransferase n=1 Tax=Kitasatospora sp. NBC_01287 TaxID=2903573 RepID=UPI0022538FE9|nr:class I SAM-dependent methyltransferase [Kitasatospora sp. NBC_01287]MCX4746930.1 class I SAM-dependent methyltransferase [Kitasatospora sp. NBC_01287]
MPAPEALVITDPVLRACLDDGPPDIGSLWELCMLFEFDREAVADGIAAWLGDPAGQRVLDCACGSGFPALQLVRRGYDVTCTDGSELMLRHFRRNAKDAGLAVEPSLLLWSELPRRHAGEFDVVINRGGGNYKYAGAWEQEKLPDRGAMAEAIGQWVRCVRPGGRFYVDIASDSDAGGADSWETEHPPMLVGEHRVELTERIAVDRARGVRSWESRLVVDGTAHEFRRLSHSITSEELVQILRDCGLVDIRLTEVAGEHYDIYTAIRP